VSSPVPQGLLLAYFGLIGALVGSFLNVVIARLPAGESIVAPRSRCPQCKKQIAWYDNVPILSFALLRARCRSCGTKISFRYPLVELLMCLLSLSLCWRFGWSWDLGIWFPLFAVLLAIIFIDIDHWLIPDVLTFPAMAWALAASFLPGAMTPQGALLGLIPAAGLWGVAAAFQKVTGKEGMGLGDVKLLALLGLALGLMGAMTALVLASVQGVVVGIGVAVSGGHKPESAPAPAFDDGWVPPPRAIPFGPFLALATFEVVLLPDLFGGVLERLSLAIVELMR
jgi:leader peptidase (prepilin peptidase) / N-methyltransferase